MNKDARDPLGKQVFDWRESKDGKVFISFEGRPVTTLAGKLAVQFLGRVRGADSREAQLLMAKATKNFKHGNERLGKNSTKR